MQKLFNAQFILLSVMILIAAISRLLTNELHMWNFTPIAAMALFSGAHFRDRKLAFVVPIIAMLITDAIIGFHGGMWYVYGTLILITIIGFFLRNNVRVGPVIVASLSSSVIFFLLTNFFVWLGSPVFAQEWKGLLACYTAGIPFFGNTVAGDLFYCGVLFGSYEVIKKRFPAFSRAK